MPAKAADDDKKGAKKAPTTAAKKTAKKKSAAKPAAKTASASAPKKSAAKATRSKPASPAKVRVRQVRSGIGHRRDFRLTLEALGIRHHQDEIVVKRSPAIDGMLYKVRHLIRVTPEE